ncbi:MAG TPA: YcxB family protein [Dongiaceae bacterium]|nr:YcxB family protein [Dongiaceae bacterium]
MDGLATRLAKEAGLGTAVGTTIATDINGLDPREVVDIRFFLKPEELDEAAAVRKVKSNTPASKTRARVICGLGGLYAASVPYLRGATWTWWWQHRPESAIFWGALLVVDVYIVLGQPGMQKLNRHFNRLDVERRICVSHRGIDITHGRLRQQKTWSDFSFYQETPTIFLLQTNGQSFWTVPKRAIPAGREDQLQTLLRAKLQRR